MNNKLSFELILLALMTISFIGIQSANAITLTPTQHDCIVKAVTADMSGAMTVQELLTNIHQTDTAGQYQSIQNAIKDVEACLK
jgi:hypothetical protein